MATIYLKKSFDPGTNGRAFVRLVDNSVNKYHRHS